MSRQKTGLQWTIDTFGPQACSPRERALRFLEESLELIQATGLTEDDIQRVAKRVYSKSAGEIALEIGQTLLVLETLAESNNVNADAEAEKELARVQRYPKEYWQARHLKKQKIGITDYISKPEDMIANAVAVGAAEACTKEIWKLKRPSSSYTRE